MNYRELLARVAESLRGLDEAKTEARHLVAAAANMKLSELPGRGEQTVPDSVCATATEWATRRASGYPLAYLSGRKGFYKYEFLVMPKVLIPRPETEQVIEVTLARARQKSLVPAEIADLGCGSGVLGLSLLREFPAAHLQAVDISTEACAVTRKNGEVLGVSGRSEVFERSVESWTPAKAFDVVVANPPYIALGDAAVQPSVHKFEPHIALYSGPDGLEAIRAWSHWAYRNLLPGGLFVFEFGTGQSAAVQTILARIGFGAVRIDRDLQGLERVASAHKRGSHG